MNNADVVSSTQKLLEKRRPALYRFLAKHSLKDEVWSEAFILDEQGKLKRQNKWYVSNKGRVISICYNEIAFKTLTADPKDGYCRIRLSSKDEWQYVHRLVAIAFLPMELNVNYKTDMIVHHIDHNRMNNDVSNLIWMSKKEHDAMKKEKKEIQDNG